MKESLSVQQYYYPDSVFRKVSLEWSSSDGTMDGGRKFFTDKGARRFTRGLMRKWDRLH